MYYFASKRIKFIVLNIKCFQAEYFHLYRSLVRYLRLTANSAVAEMFIATVCDYSMQLYPEECFMVSRLDVIVVNNVKSGTEYPHYVEILHTDTNVADGRTSRPH